MSPRIGLGLVLAVLWPISSFAANPSPPPAAAGSGPIPVENFAKQQAVYHPTISRDGLFLAYTVLADAYYRDFAVAVALQNLATGKISSVKTGLYETAVNPRWVSNDRIVYGDLSGIDRDLKNHKGLNGFARFGFEVAGHVINNVSLNLGEIIFRRFTGAKEGNILVLAYDGPAEQITKTGWFYPSVINMDTRTGVVTTVMKNPGKVVGWLPDNNGMILAGVEHGEDGSKAIFRENENAAWHTLPGLEHVKPTLGLQGFSADKHTLYVSLPTPTGTWGVFAYDLQKQQLGDLVAGHDHYDVLRNHLWADGNLLDQVVFAPRTGEILGVQFVADKPKSVWFDPTLAAVQGALDHARSDRVNSIVDMSDDLRKFVVFSWGAKDPGTYCLFDLNKKQLQPLFAIMPWIKPEQMAEVYPFSYKSRDGLPIHRYLTVPAGKEPKNLPMVVMPYDGPLTRMSWEFNRDAQFLASRGYAVLQMNYRGSTGYGEKFLEKGVGHIGREMQDDIVDGTRWAIAQGICDPHRIAIMGGGNIGGFCALMGLIRGPDIYRCGIDLAGITNWRSIAKNHQDILEYNSATFIFGQLQVVDLLGDDGKNDVTLSAISPVVYADQVRAPILIVYNKDDTTQGYKQARFLRDALDKAHKRYETVKCKGEPNTLLFDDRVDLLKRIEQFLAQNMTP